MFRSLLFVVVCGSSTALACEETDRELQGAFEAVWTRVGHATRARLEQAQAAWFEYREATCQLYAARPHGIAEDAMTQCFRYMMRERVTELEFMAKVLPEADPDEQDQEDAGC